MVLPVSFVLSPVIGFIFTVASAMRSIVANLMPASRHQDHTTSPSASMRVVATHPCVHRIPHPTFVTTAKRPSGRGGVAGVIRLILAAPTAEYFLSEDWTPPARGCRLICPTGKSASV